MRFIIILLVIFLPNIATSAEILYFNAEVLGKKTNENVQLLENHEGPSENFISPAIVQTDIENGTYTAASIYYSHSAVDASQLIKSIDNKYPGTRRGDVCKNDYCTWRIEEQKFLLSLVQEQEEEMHRLIYIKFRKFNPQEMAERISKAIEAVNKNCK